MNDRFTLGWDSSMGCYRVSVPNLEGPIEVVTAASHDVQREELLTTRSWLGVAMTLMTADQQMELQARMRRIEAEAAALADASSKSPPEMTRWERKQIAAMEADASRREERT
jgi:hypothetical protein